jgi:hypothetical protein
VRDVLDVVQPVDHAIGAGAEDDGELGRRDAGIAQEPGELGAVEPLVSARRLRPGAAVQGAAERQAGLGVGVALVLLDLGPPGLVEHALALVLPGIPEGGDVAVLRLHRVDLIPSIRARHIGLLCCGHGWPSAGM